MATALHGANLNEQVYDELRARVLTRQHPAGAKLSLHALASELGVSRSPVHHALTRLVSEGLLTVKPRRGYYVTAGHRASRWPRATTCGSRSSCTPPSARSAVSALASSRRLRSLLDATADAISHEEWDTANAAFHEYQIDLAGNALLSRFYRELSVNLMMQVIRGGRSRATRTSSPSTAASSRRSTPATPTARSRAIRAHIETGRRIAWKRSSARAACSRAAYHPAHGNGRA